jgi:hypothetical protein
MLLDDLHVISDENVVKGYRVAVGESRKPATRRIR